MKFLQRNRAPCVSDQSYAAAMSTAAHSASPCKKLFLADLAKQAKQVIESRTEKSSPTPPVMSREGELKKTNEGKKLWWPSFSAKKAAATEKGSLSTLVGGLVVLNRIG